MKTESGDVIRFIKKGSIFLLALFLLDFLIGMGISGLFSKQKGGQIYQTTMGLESVHTDVLVFGASNASHHYVPSVFRDSLGMSFFNLGRDGMDILYGKAIFNGIVRRYCPKIIIINLSPTELSTDLSYDRLSPLLPYYRTHPEIKEIVSLRSRFEHVKLFSRLYPFNSLFFTVVKGSMKSSNERTDNGYIPLYGELSVDAIPKKPIDNNPVVDTNRVNILTSFIRESLQKKIRVYLVISPYFRYHHNPTASLRIIDSIASAFHVRVFDHLYNERFAGHAELFKDNSHMNNTGATIFSSVVSGQIRESIRKRIKILP